MNLWIIGKSLHRTPFILRNKRNGLTKRGSERVESFTVNVRWSMNPVLNFKNLSKSLGKKERESVYRVG